MRIFALLFLLSFSISSISQTSIGGIINDYAEVEFIDACEGKVLVSDASQYNVNDQIIVIQMQGAVINEDNNANFGTITDIRSTGLYEVATIIRKSADTLFTENILLNEYDIDGSIQVVSYPNYENALITNELTARPWNGSIGGLLAFSVENELTFNADINITGTGFRGGTSVSNANNCTGALNNANQYFYSFGNWRGAQKGEGIAIKILDKQNGRGAQANGGGGGNDHNSGGGGGGNVSAGGMGGERISNFITGDCRGNNPGEAGKFFPREANRVFMGGGGGAGHSNNDMGENGGNGGGILIAQATRVIGEGFAINSNGIGTNEIALGDGAGGGGAGGSVIFLWDEMTTSISINAFGGKGADVDNDFSNACFGPGGGGSGGYVFTGEAITTVNVSGGQNGLSTRSSRGNCGANDSTPGDAGIVESDLTVIPESNFGVDGVVWITQPEQAILICQGEDLLLMGEAIGQNLNYQWQQFDGSNFINLNNVGNVSGTQSNTLSVGMINTSGIEQYRLVVVDNCGNMLESNTSVVDIQEASVANFSFVVNNDVVQFTNLSINATSYLWDFGDGNSTITADPTYTYTSNGVFTVTLRVSGPCGVDQISMTVSVNNLNPPIPDFATNITEGCEPFMVEFLNLSSNAENFFWSFPGGQPSTSTDENPTVTFDTEGIYTVKLVVENSVGSDSIERVDYITVFSEPVASFTITINGFGVDFINTSTGATSFEWDFGDGNTSNLESPSHTYLADGLFEVTLTVTNLCGTSTETTMIEIGSIPEANFTANETEGCAPFTVQFSNLSSPNTISFNWFFPGGNPVNSTDQNPQVTYDIPGTYTVLLEVANGLGIDTIERINYITVGNVPIADFTFTNLNRFYQFESSSTNADSFEWDFGDGNTSFDENPEHTYLMNGEFTVTLTVRNECGEDTATQTFMAGGPPTADFENNISNGCAPVTITFTDISTGDVTNRTWNFPGGDVTTSIDETVSVTYSTPGVYDVILMVENAFGDDMVVKSSLIEVQPRPFAGFTYEVNGSDVQFVNTSSNGTIFTWDFGDGNTSNEENPMHTYAGSGDFVVNLIAANDFCNSSISTTVSITTSSAREISFDSNVKVYPNPVAEFLTIEIEQDLVQNVTSFMIVDVTGKVVQNKNAVQIINELNVSDLAAGIYFLKVQTIGQPDLVSRFVKE